MIGTQSKSTFDYLTGLLEGQDTQIDPESRTTKILVQAIAAQRKYQTAHGDVTHRLVHGGGVDWTTDYYERLVKAEVVASLWTDAVENPERAIHRALGHLRYETKSTSPMSNVVDQMKRDAARDFLAGIQSVGELTEAESRLFVTTWR